MHHVKLDAGYITKLLAEGINKVALKTLETRRN